MEMLSNSSKLATEEFFSDPVPAEEVAYCRVSDDRDQDPDFQIELMRKRGIPDRNIFIDHESGRSMKRPGLKKALIMLEERKGWSLVVWKLNRLGRDTLGLIQLANDFLLAGINLVSLTEPIDTRTPFGRYFLTQMAGFAQLESDLIGERTRAGMARRKELGIRIGRHSQITPQQFRKIESMLLTKPKLTIKQIGAEFRVSASCINHHFPGWRGKSERERIRHRQLNPLPNS
jgi:DNA invertase Pin-like site-specific DNA recombinase